MSKLRFLSKLKSGTITVDDLSVFLQRAALNWFDVLMFHFAFNLIDMIIRSEMEKYNFSLKCL